MVQPEKTVRDVGGARNPFALAELISGEKITWESMSSLEMRQKLTDTLSVPYESLFTPQNDSPLYRDTRTGGRGKI